MDLRKRIFRKPVTTIAWLAVLTAMALLLGIGSNLLHSADSLLAIIDQHHTTIGVQTVEAGLTPEGNYQKLSVTLKKSEIEELSALDSVEKIDLRTLTGAYIPELTAQIGLTDWGTLCQADYDTLYNKINESYNEVILTGTVEYAWREELETWTTRYDCSQVGGTTEMAVRRMHAIVKIDQIPVANPAYVFFENEKYSLIEGRIHVEVDMYCDVADESQYFEVGEKYIFCGSYDPLAKHASEPESDPVYRDLIGMGKSFPILTLGARYSTPGGIIKDSEALNINGQLIKYPIVGFIEERDPEVVCQPEQTAVLAQKLTTSVEALAAAEPLWAEALEKYEIAQHTFPVLGTEALETMYVFNRNDASLISGRMFTQEEYDSGAKVCVISEALALSGDIQVGDNVSFSQYICGKSLDDGNSSLAYDLPGTASLSNPAVGRIVVPDGFVTEDEKFQVVGIYKLSRSWDSSAFSITPNTVFVPQKAQIEGGYGGPSYSAFGNGIWEFGISYPNGAYGVYFSIQIKNGQADEFTAQADEIVPNLFHIFDQGYEAAEESVLQVAVDAWKLIGIAFIGWLLLLALYVLLYQNKEKANLGIIRSLGGSPKTGRRYLFGSGILVAAAGILTGTLCSSGVTRLVSKQLAEFMFNEGTMQTMSGGMELGTETVADILSRSSLPAADQLLLCGAQLAIIAAALWLHAYFTAKKQPRKLLGV